jgi:cob(I)alamin adenosyltransferase
MKIYTRQGDNGTTGILGKDRLSKADLRIECIGTVDELNAAMGLAETVTPDALRPLLRQVQHELFTIGSHLAAVDEAAFAQILPPITDEMITRLEREIDVAEAQAGPLQHFILSGGCEAAARLHLARAICRRAERHVVALTESQSLNPQVCKYLNRLADWLFMHARYANRLCGVKDVPWQKQQRT